MLNVLAAIQVRSRGECSETCHTLPFRRYFAIVKSRRVVRIESEKSGKCHSKLVHSLRLHTFNHCFPCGYGFNQTKKGEKAMKVSLFTVHHVFVEFVEGIECGIRNPESGMRNSQPFSFCYLWKIISHLQNFFCISFFKIIEY